MSTGVPSIEDLIAFTARLDELRADQHPDDLSDALRTAFKERQLYEAYFFFLSGGAKRAKLLLYVFDKVRSVICTTRRTDFQRLLAKQALTAATFDVTIFKQFRQLCDRTGLQPTSHIIPEESIRWSHGSDEPWDVTVNGRPVKALCIHREGVVQEVKKVPQPMFLVPLGTSS